MGGVGREKGKGGVGGTTEILHFNKNQPENYNHSYLFSTYAKAVTKLSKP